LRAIELERVDAARALFGIEPAFRQKHAHRVDAVLEAVQRASCKFFSPRLSSTSSRLLPARQQLRL
jgi:hypothetical protein